MRCQKNLEVEKVKVTTVSKIHVNAVLSKTVEVKLGERALKLAQSKMSRLGVATLNGKIYACGGYDGSSFLRSVECFDPETNRFGDFQ